MISIVCGTLQNMKKLMVEMSKTLGAPGPDHNSGIKRLLTGYDDAHE